MICPYKEGTLDNICYGKECPYYIEREMPGAIKCRKVQKDLNASSFYSMAIKELPLIRKELSKK